VDVAERTGGTVIHARCYEAERSLFLQPFVDALGDHAATANPAVIRDAIGEWAAPVVALVPQIDAILDDMPPPHVRGEVARRRAYDAFARYICRFGDVARAPCAGRSAPRGTGHRRTVALPHPPLGNRAVTDHRHGALGGGCGDTHRLIRRRRAVGTRTAVQRRRSDIADHAGHPELAERIAARTGGHPLFVVETLHALAGGGTGIPDNLHVAVLSRVRRAGERTEDLLRAAAVLGTPVTEGVAHLLDGLRIAEMLGDRAIEADMLGRLAIIASNRLQFSEAVGYGNRAVRAAHASGDDDPLACALDGLKTPYAYLGEIDALVPVLTELEPLLRQRGDLWRLQWTIHESAFPALAAGRWDEAVARITDALEINRRSGYSAYEGWFVGHLGWVHRLAGDLEQARVYGYRAIDLTRESTHAWWRSAACTQLAGTLLALGETESATELLDEGRAHASRDGAEAYLLNCLGPLADVTGDRGILETADALLATVDAPDGYAMGAQAGEAPIRQLVTDAGFTRFRRATETPFNNVYEARR
jgi:tetratricopeptide (TPR) repeat protein